MNEPAEGGSRPGVSDRIEGIDGRINRFSVSVRGHRIADLVSNAAGIFVAIIGTLVLIGWAIDIPILKEVRPGLAAMKPNTAAAFVLGGLALLLEAFATERPGVQRVKRACATLVALIGTITLAEYLFDRSIGIDELIFKDDSERQDASHPGRMAPNTALGFLLVGIGILVNNVSSVRRLRDTVLTMAAVIGLTAVIGYLYGVSSLYGIAASTQMALHTAMALVFLSIGALCLFPDGSLVGVLFTSGTAGKIARRIVPGAIILPIFLGWLRLEGERMGLYAANFGLSLMVLTTIILLSATILLTLGSVEASDKKSRRLEINFRELIEAAHDAIVVVGPEGDIQLVNRQTEILFGHPRADLIGRPVEILIPSRYQADHASHRSSYASTPLRREMGVGRELVGARKNGTEFPVEVSLSPLEADTHRQVMATIRDVTDRNKAELALRVYADLAKNTPIGLIVWRLENLDNPRSLTLRACNSSAERVLGIPLHRRIGETIAEIFPAAAATPRLESYAEVVRRAEPRSFGEVRSVEEGFRDRIFDVHAFPLPDQSLGISFEDITDRMRTDEMRAQLAAIVESSNDAIIGKSLDGTITTWNKAAETMFQFSAAESIGKPVTLVIPQSRLDEELQLIERLKLGENVRQLETLRIKKDGTEFDVSATLSPIKNQSGEVVGISTIVRDIADKKRAERALIVAKESAEASNRELESFSFSVSHDLRAPLRAIDGFSQALLEDNLPRLDDVGKQHLSRIRAAAQRMGQLIDDLIKLSLVNRSELQFSEVDLSRIVREFVEERRQNEPNRSIEVAIQDHLMATGDARLLRVALDNLMENAWKFTARREQARIEVGVLPPKDGRTVYFVRDNGAGFDMIYVHKLFGAFQRLHSMTEFPGTGIGLATVQRVIRRHGGRVWAEGTVGEGATFFFTLSNDRSE